jgi:hypothetical protein
MPIWGLVRDHGHAITRLTRGDMSRLFANLSDRTDVHKKLTLSMVRHTFSTSQLALTI